MTAAQALVGRFDFGRVIQNTFGVVKRNWQGLTLLSVVLVGIPAAFFGWLQVTTLGLQGERMDQFNGGTALIWVVGILASMVASALLQATTVRVSVADLNGNRVSALDELRKSLPALLPIIVLSIVMTVAIMVAAFFLVVPALILAVLWSVALPALVVERISPFAALSRSRNLTRGSRWRIVGLFFIYLAIYFVLTLVVGGIIGALSMASTGLALIGTVITSVVSAVISGLVGAVGIAVLYYELRSTKEGVGVDQLASVFD